MNRRHSLLAAAFAALLTVVLCATALADSPPANLQAVVPDASITILVDGREIVPDVPPVIVEGRTLVPLRAVADALGFAVTYEPETRRITLAQPAGSPQTIHLWLDKSYAYIDDRSVPLDVPPRVIRDRTFVPLRFVADQIGADVEWVESERTVQIRTVASNPPTADPGVSDPGGGSPDVTGPAVTGPTELTGSLPPAAPGTDPDAYALLNRAGARAATFERIALTGSMSLDICLGAVDPASGEYVDLSGSCSGGTATYTALGDEYALWVKNEGVDPAQAEEIYTPDHLYTRATEGEWSWEPVTDVGADIRQLRGSPLLLAEREVRVWYDSSDMPDSLAGTGAVGIRLWTPPDYMTLLLQLTVLGVEVTPGEYECDIRFWVDPATNFLYAAESTMRLDGTFVLADLGMAMGSDTGTAPTHGKIALSISLFTTAQPTNAPVQLPPLPTVTD